MARFEEGALGLMGLGFKSPLAYTSAFYFICRKDGMERKYMMYEGEEGNAIDPLYDEVTTEPNGVKVIVPLKPGDRGSFVTKIEEQLAYFEGVYFDCDGYVSNNFLINRSDLFQYSELSHDSDMHLCLDNVYYPLDFGKLGIDRINVPIGLRFGLTDGIFPIPNRESLRYTPEAKQTILNKIALVADYFVDKYNSQIVNTDNLESVFHYYETKVRSMMLGTKNYDIATLIPFSQKSIVEPSYTGVKYLDLKQLYKVREHIMNEYTRQYTYNRGKISESNDKILAKDLKSGNYYLFTDKVSGNKREYMKSILNGTYYFVKKVRSFTLGNRYSNSYNNYHVLLALDKRPKHLWRKIIVEFQQIQKIFIAMFKDYDSIDIPKSWLDERKKKRVSIGGGRRVKLTGQIFGKICVPLERYVSGKNSKLVPLTLDLAVLHKHKGLTVYTSYDDAPVLDPLYTIAGHGYNIRCVAFSDREMKLVKTIDVHNFISYEKFMEGKNMPFKRLVTAYLIDELMTKYRYVFEKKEHLKTISTELSIDVNALAEYKYKYYNTRSVENIYEAMLEVANEHHLFDPLIHSTYLKIKLVLKKLKFLDIILKQSTHGSSYGYRTTTSFTPEETHELLVDMFKHYKFKINIENYKLPDPVVPVEDVTIEEDEEPEEGELDDEDKVLTEEELVELQEQVV